MADEQLTQQPRTAIKPYGAAVCLALLIVVRAFFSILTGRRILQQLG